MVGIFLSTRARADAFHTNNTRCYILSLLLLADGTFTDTHSLIDVHVASEVSVQRVIAHR